MRFRLWLQAAFAVAALSFPVSSWSQFQSPTDEELKMTAEPKAPGAAAIYLYREETVDDNLHFHSFYARIKVLTEKGKELATVHLPSTGAKFAITDVKARTIHSDGTVIPLDVKPADLVEYKGTELQIKKMGFTLPSVEVGSILEYRWELRYNDKYLSAPQWEVQQHYFVRKAHYSFLPFKYLNRVVNGRGDAASKLLYSTTLPAGVTVNHEGSGKFTLDVSDVAPVPDEEYMPPVGSFMEHVQFYYSEYFTKEDFWKHEDERWSKEADHFSIETETLKSAVATIVAPTDSEDVKARKIYDAVMALENTDYTRRKSQTEMSELRLKKAKDAEEVWIRKSGSRNEIALLFMAMARIAGLKAHAMTVCNRNRRIFDPYYLSFSQFQDDLVLVTIDGKDVTLDPGVKFAPFGELSWRHQQVTSLRQTENGTEIGATPASSYKDATTVRAGDLTIAEDGGVKGTLRITMSGPAALQWRQMALQNDTDEVAKRYNEQLRGMVPDGVDAELDHFLGLDDYHTMLMAVVKISGKMGTETGKRVFLPAVFFESHARHPFVAEDKRVTAVDMEYADSVRDEVTYHLPESFSVESAPSDTSIPLPGHAAFQLKSVANQKDVTVERSFIRGFALLGAKDYSALRDFYQKVASADQQQLVLKVAPTISGN